MQPVYLDRHERVDVRAEIVRWKVDAGARVEEGQLLADYRQAGRERDLCAPSSGILARHFLQAGFEVPAETLAAIISDEPDLPFEWVVREYGLYLHVPSGYDGYRARQLTGGFGERSALALARVEGGDARPALLVHGFGGARSSWARSYRRFLKDRDILALDLPGHGASSEPRGASSCAALANEIAQALDDLGLRELHVVAHSLGAAICMRLAQQRPDLLHSLSLIAPLGLGDEIDLSHLGGFLAAESSGKMSDIVSKLFFDSSKMDGGLVTEVLRMKQLTGTPEMLQRVMNTFTGEHGDREDLRPLLSSLRMPRLIVWGTSDVIVPPSQGGGLPDEIPVRLIEEAGHLPHVEKPDDFADILVPHLASLDRA